MQRRTLLSPTRRRVMASTVPHLFVADLLVNLVVTAAHRDGATSNGSAGEECLKVVLSAFDEGSVLRHIEQRYLVVGGKLLEVYAPRRAGRSIFTNTTIIKHACMYTLRMYVCCARLPAFLTPPFVAARCRNLQQLVAVVLSIQLRCFRLRRACLLAVTRNAPVSQ